METRIRFVLGMVFTIGPPGGERRKAMETPLLQPSQFERRMTAGGRTPKGNGDSVKTNQRGCCGRGPPGGERRKAMETSFQVIEPCDLLKTAGGRTPKGNGD